MNKGLKKGLIGFIIPVAVIVIAYKFNIWLGLAALIIYIALLLYTSRAMIFIIIGSRNYSLGKTEPALNWFKRAHDTKKASVRSSITYAYILLKNGKPIEAEEILKELLKNNPNNQDTPPIKSIIALVLWKKGELDAAITLLEEVLSTYKTTSVYGSLGYLLNLKGDPEKALQFNLEAYEYNSTDNIILDNLGQNYYLMSMYDNAKEIYESLVGKAPTFPEAYYNYGLVLEKLGEIETALDMFKKALDYKFSFVSTITQDEVKLKIQKTRKSASLMT